MWTLNWSSDVEFITSVGPGWFQEIVLIKEEVLFVVFRSPVEVFRDISWLSRI